MLFSELRIRHDLEFTSHCYICDLQSSDVGRTGAWGLGRRLRPYFDVYLSHFQGEHVRPWGRTESIHCDHQSTTETINMKIMDKKRGEKGVEYFFCDHVRRYIYFMNMHVLIETTMDRKRGDYIHTYRGERKPPIFPRREVCQAAVCMCVCVQQWNGNTRTPPPTTTT